MAGTDVLIVYGTRHGQTEKVARRIASRLGERAIPVDAYPCPGTPGGLRPEDYGAVVVASPVHFGRHLRCIERFARRHAPGLAATHGVLISVCGAAMGSTPEDRAEADGYLEDFADRTGWRADRQVSLAGAVPYTRYGLLTRWIMKRISRRRGLSTDTSRDHDYTDWSSVDGLSEELVERVRSPRAPHAPTTVGASRAARAPGAASASTSDG